jgi:hypothetical protein
VNNYCDITRTYNTEHGANYGKLACISDIKKVNVWTPTTDDATVAKLSAVYDFPILLVTIYHMIEWIRWTVLATSALVDANLIPLFYALHINIVFGFFAMLIGIIQGAGAPTNCSTI